MPNQRKGKSLVVGLDFGTTHTGISFGLTGFENTHRIEEWPKLDGSIETACKTPTYIAYPPREPSHLWGHQVESNLGLCAWMKYHLDRDGHETDYDDKDFKQELENGFFKFQGPKSPDDVTTDYLKEVFKFALTRLEKLLQRSAESKRNIVNVTKIKWWLAKPATWGAKAQTRLQTIVKNAAEEVDFGGARSLDEFNFISEPEAAAFSLLGDVHKTEPKLKKDDLILVCACGGGTVDVAVFAITSTSPNIEFEEATRGVGAKCGSAYLDMLFHKLMSKRFIPYDSIEWEKKTIGSEFMKAFETNKHIFEPGVPLVDIPLRMRDIAESRDDYDIRDGQVRLAEDDMKTELFEKVILKIIAMISDQKKAAEKRRRGCPTRKVTDLLLVGGLGRSPYLRSQIQDWCDKKGVRMRKLKSEENSWGAVSYGAVLRGLDRAKIEKRIARFHYGMLCDLVHDPALDADTRPYIHPFSGQLFTPGTVLWFVKAGSVISKDTIDWNKSNSRPEIIQTELSEGQREIEVKIVFCGASVGPRKNGKEVHAIGSLVIRVSAINLKEFRMRKLDGSEGINLTYIIQQGPGSGQGSLMFKAMTLKDVPLGESEIKLDRG